MKLDELKNEAAGLLDALRGSAHNEGRIHYVHDDIFSGVDKLLGDIAALDVPVVKFETARLNAKIESLEADLAAAVEILSSGFLHPKSCCCWRCEFYHRPNVRAILERDGK